MHLGINLGGLGVGMAQHLGNDFQRHSGFQGNGSGKRMSGNMGGEVPGDFGPNGHLL